MKENALPVCKMVYLRFYRKQSLILGDIGAKIVFCFGLFLTVILLPVMKISKLV